MRTNKGVVESVILYYVIAGMLLLFVPNPISNAIGIGNRQNKIVQTKETKLINNKDGVPIAYETTTSNRDEQQHITFWEQIRSLPVFILFLMVMGIIFPPIALVLGNLWTALKRGTKQIVVSVDKALDNVQDPEIKKQLLTDMSTKQDASTEKIVNKIQGKT